MQCHEQGGGTPHIPAETHKHTAMGWLLPHGLSQPSHLSLFLARPAPKSTLMRPACIRSLPYGRISWPSAPTPSARQVIPSPWVDRPRKRLSREPPAGSLAKPAPISSPSYWLAIPSSLSLPPRRPVTGPVSMHDPSRNASQCHHRSFSCLSVLSDGYLLENCRERKPTTW